MTSPGVRRSPSTWSRCAVEVFQLCEGLPITGKLNDGQFDSITFEDVDELFMLLDVNCNGSLEFVELRRFFVDVLNPACTQHETELIRDLVARDDNDEVSPDSLFTALSSPMVHQHLSRRRMQKHLRTAPSGTTHLEIDRGLLVHQGEELVERNDSLRKLLSYFVWIVVLMLLVRSHLFIYSRQRLEHGIEDLVEDTAHGYGWDFEDYNSEQRLWNWLTDAGLSLLLGNCGGGGNSSSAAHCRIGSRNWLVGDLKLTPPAGEHFGEEVWLLHSEASLSHLSVSPGDYFGAALAEIRHLRDSGFMRWDGSGQSSSDRLTLAFTLFNDRVGMFALNEIVVRFHDYGIEYPICISNAIAIDAYPSPLVFVLDAIYVLLLLVPAGTESWDLFQTMRLAGCYHGLKEYMGFWNAVDWINIILGFWSVVTWVMLLFAMGVDAPFRDVLLERGGALRLVDDTMNLSTDRLDATNAALNTISSLYIALHLVMTGSCIVNMLIFFKGIQANPQLRLVPMTLVNATQDIVHFSLILGAIFFGYALVGHVCFGQSIGRFHSVAKSVHTLFCCLMGEFDWYTEASDSDHPLNGNVPLWTLSFFFFSYMTLVLLIILNMLLAIVLAQYDQEKSAAAHLTIWKQLYDYAGELWQTRGFMPMTSIVTQLKDPDPPTHPEHFVTSDTLMRAFPGMSHEQAVFIMGVLTEEAQREHDAEQPHETAKFLEKIEHFVGLLSRELKIVNLNLHVSVDKFGQIGGDKLVVGNASRNGNAARLRGVPLPQAGLLLEDVLFLPLEPDGFAEARKPKEAEPPAYFGMADPAPEADAEARIAALIFQELRANARDEGNLARVAHELDEASRSRQKYGKYFAPSSRSTSTASLLRMPENVLSSCTRRREATDDGDGFHSVGEIGLSEMGL